MKTKSRKSQMKFRKSLPVELRTNEWITIRQIRTRKQFRIWGVEYEEGGFQGVQEFTSVDPKHPTYYPSSMYEKVNWLLVENLRFGRKTWNPSFRDWRNGTNSTYRFRKMGIVTKVETQNDSASGFLTSKIRGNAKTRPSIIIQHFTWRAQQTIFNDNETHAI